MARPSGTQVKTVLQFPVLCLPVPPTCGTDFKKNINSAHAPHALDISSASSSPLVQNVLYCSWKCRAESSGDRTACDSTTTAEANRFTVLAAGTYTLLQISSHELDSCCPRTTVFDAPKSKHALKFSLVSEVQIITGFLLCFIFICTSYKSQTCNCYSGEMWLYIIQFWIVLIVKALVYSPTLTPH